MSRRDFRMSLRKQTEKYHDYADFVVSRFGLDPTLRSDSHGISDDALWLLMDRIARGQYMTFTKLLDHHTASLRDAHTQNKPFNWGMLHVAVTAANKTFKTVTLTFQTLLIESIKTERVPSLGPFDTVTIVADRVIVREESGGPPSKP